MLIMEFLLISSHAYLFKRILSFFIVIILLASPSMVLASSRWSDHSALLAFKSQIQEDPFEALSSWNHSLRHCHWPGITCNRRGQVTDLELPSFSLEGILSPHIGNLTFLQKLDLTENNFHGEIPQELGRLFNLQYIWLQNNSFGGQIPINITRCSDLREINFMVNKLSGNIFVELSFLSKLEFLGLSRNTFSGNIPSALGNLSSLTKLSLLQNQLVGNIPNELCHIQSLEFFQVGENQLTGELPPCLYNNSNIYLFSIHTNQLEGSLPPGIGLTLPNIQVLYLYKNNFIGNIPSSLGNLSSLTELRLHNNHIKGSILENLCHIQSLNILQVAINNLTGTFPSCFYNLSNINIIDVTGNNLEGSLPTHIGLNLPKIQGLYLSINKFSGLIPISLTNATTLEVLEFSNNGFTGPIPKDLGKLYGLRLINLGKNQLGTKEGNDLEFINSLTNCTNLQYLLYGYNFLDDRLPESISNLSSKLTILEATTNKIYGTIPVGIGNLVNIEIVNLGDNHLTGNMPIVIGKLNKIREINFNRNMLSGPIPGSLGNLTQLIRLYLGSNNFSANIPPTLEHCKSLAFLNLSRNKLTGSIPKQLSTLSLIIGLSFHHNLLTGSLPPQIGNLTNIMYLDVSENNLSGRLPETLGSCLSLKDFDTHKNFFQGEIPKSFSAFHGLQYFDLSRNNLTGEIPEYLERFPLLYLNLSHNQFKGQVPTKGVFRNASAISVVENNDLCGGIRMLKLPSCIKKVKKTSLSKKVVLTLIVGCLSMLLLLCFLSICYWRKTSTHKPSVTTLSDRSYIRVTYSELLKATNGFTNDNLIGVGSYGRVFKGVLQHINQIVAVKVLDLERKGASKSFLTECNALRSLRHRNLLKIITACSSVDFQGNHFKALVLEFMPRGSLEDLLHPREEQQFNSRTFNFTQRMSVATDVASALEYLHHNNPVEVVHCDLKPSNVLLDDDMVAHVADFGIAKIFSVNIVDSEQTLTNSVAIKGSIGYVAPEYGMGGNVSIQGDVYSYGILLLEMFTRKRPTDDMFIDGLSLHSYAKIALPNQVMDIIDPLIISGENFEELDKTGHGNARAILNECLVEIISLGVACSAELSVERMLMSEAVTKLYHIMERYGRVGSNLE